MTRKEIEERDKEIDILVAQEKSKLITSVLDNNNVLRRLTQGVLQGLPGGRREDIAT